MSSELSKYILTTITYYDVLDYPLTAFEVWKYLTIISPESGVEKEKEGYRLADIIDELQGDGLKDKIEEYRGFYFLKERRSLVGKRIKRNKISEEKFKIIEKLALWLRFIPFVRMIAVTGRVAMKNAEKKSDLDLLVVLERGRIFTGRTLVTLAAQLLGRRRHGEKITDRACLNHFVTTSSLEVEPKDLFASSEYFFIFPIFGGEMFKAFGRANGWISEYRANYVPEEIDNLKMIKDSKLSGFLRKAGEKIFGLDFIEQKLKDWEIGRIKKDPRTSKKGSLILADDDRLVFLPSPQGPKVFQKFFDKLDKQGAAGDS